MEINNKGSDQWNRLQKRNKNTILTIVYNFNCLFDYKKLNLNSYFDNKMSLKLATTIGIIIVYALPLRLPYLKMKLK